MKDVDVTSLALGLGCGGKPLDSLRLPPVEPSLTLGVSEEIYGSMAISKKSVTACRQARKPTSPHSTISSFSTANYSIKEEKTAGGDEGPSRGSDDDEETGARKKLRLTKEQSALLEDRFREHSTLSPKQKQALANRLNLRPRQVEVWFQNRRARTKLKQKEIDFEFLKRCFETLKEENLRLHKELKSLKFAPPPPRPPPLYMQLPSAATLAMCPSCERNMAGAGTARNKAAASAGGFTAAAKPSHLFNAITRSAAC